MKVLIENPQGSLLAGCIMVFFALFGVTLLFLILSSIGYSIGNMGIWTTAIFSELSFIVGFLTGGNLKERHK